ncbi:hypothetical protein HR060_01910 [Catenovulum sp. SM1970]|uniref:hypothetical protein n=1 Tax=Marinifaba aquimaris TaxID=2741323 RepID=UPI001571FF4D|nr:hypothetical protein [Marinifaba aquimaris]NTS75609.1 hypothetical protein [Marinifaba aquimaris]
MSYMSAENSTITMLKMRLVFLSLGMLVGVYFIFTGLFNVNNFAVVVSLSNIKLLGGVFILVACAGYFRSVYDELKHDLLKE